MSENRMDSEDQMMAKMVRPCGSTPRRVRSYVKYAVRPSTTAAKTNCATRKMRERRREKIIVLVSWRYQSVWEGRADGLDGVVRGRLELLVVWSWFGDVFTVCVCESCIHIYIYIPGNHIVLDQSSGRKTASATFTTHCRALALCNASELMRA